MNANIDETDQLEELCQRQIALADFIGSNPKSVRLIDEALGVFSAFGGTEMFLVTPGFLRDCLPTGERYGYQIYLLHLSNCAIND
jgi:hypothetical protein